LNVKRSNLSKLVGTSLLVASLLTLPATMRASAQTGTNTGTDTTTTVNDASRATDNNFADGDWGLMGLLGLFGLLGRRSRKSVENTAYDRDAVGTGTRIR
jgi:MYXO-CTERM domain-containing protein